MFNQIQLKVIIKVLPDFSFYPKIFYIHMENKWVCLLRINHAWEKKEKNIIWIQEKWNRNGAEFDKNIKQTTALCLQQKWTRQNLFLWLKGSNIWFKTTIKTNIEQFLISNILVLIPICYTVKCHTDHLEYYLFDWSFETIDSLKTYSSTFEINGCRRCCIKSKKQCYCMHP
jgi:hypothetical protein